jgi:hypothetical protein
MAQVLRPSTIPERLWPGVCDRDLPTRDLFQAGAKVAQREGLKPFCLSMVVAPPLAYAVLAYEPMCPTSWRGTDTR